ncbi:MAG: hypothetical protein U1E46_08140 [Hyphomicrobiales bacterium]
MIALIVTVCAITSAADCHDETFYFESHGSLAQCMFEAQPYIAEWSANHPKWSVSRWKCGAADEGKKI